MENEKDLLSLAKNFGWIFIVSRKELPEEFIEKYFNRLDKFLTLKYQKLSMDFIEKYKNQLPLSAVSEFQNLSLDFIMNNKKHIRWEYFSINENFSVDFKREVIPNNDRFNYCCWCDSKLKGCKVFNVYRRYCPKCLR